MSDLKGTMAEIYECFNSRDADAIEELMHDDFVEHEEVPGMPTDKKAPRAFMEMWAPAFPDFRMNVVEMLRDGDKVITRGRMTGTHEGEFMGMAATGKSFDVGFIDIVEFRDGKAIAHWGVTDAAAMMEQLGLAG